jgi:hypothetical protein
MQTVTQRVDPNASRTRAPKPMIRRGTKLNRTCHRRTNFNLQPPTITQIPISQLFLATYSTSTLAPQSSPPGTCALPHHPTTPCPKSTMQAPRIGLLSSTAPSNRPVHLEYHFPSAALQRDIRHDVCSPHIKRLPSSYQSALNPLIPAS